MLRSTKLNAIKAFSAGLINQQEFSRMGIRFIKENGKYRRETSGEVYSDITQFEQLICTKFVINREKEVSIFFSDFFDAIDHAIKQIEAK